jgi:hypothetical protein
MTGRRTTVIAFVVAAVAAALTLVVVVGAGWSPDVPLVLALATLGAVVVLALRRAFLGVAAPAFTAPSVVTRPDGGVEPRVGTIEITMRQAVEDAGICRRRLQPLLFDLATHRLRTQRGIELIEEPEQARAVLGDGPYHFLTEVVTEPISSDALDRVVKAIEGL